VLMVSEGVDIPRLRVGVYATTARTELFFRQVVGRFIRRTPTPERQMSWLLLPADPRLKQLAGQIEEERRHALDLTPKEAVDEERAERQVSERTADAFEALSSSAEAEAAILSETTLQLFATEEPAVAPSPALAAFTQPLPSAVPPAPAMPEARFESREKLRDERASLVSQLSRRTGEPHRAIHARINRATGARTVGAATREQLEKGNALLVRELAR